MDGWNELLKQALLGTDRQAAPLPALPGALGELLSPLDGSDKEGSLLRAAGVLAAYRRAGKRPSAVTTPSEPPPAESWQRCSPRAAHHFAVLIDGGYSELFPEWLEAAASCQRRIPEEQLPTALTLAQKRPELRAALLRVIGARGRWLGEKNPVWSFAAAAGARSQDEARRLWELGDFHSRAEILREMAQQEPAFATELLRSTWNEDSASDRAVFLSRAYQSLPQAADEALLEDCLDDRRKEVRQAALAILSRRPDSQFVARQTERARAYLKWTGAGRKRALDVQLPEACDKAMERDGINPKITPFKLGERAAILHQILSATPPNLWSVMAPPQDWLAAALESDYAALLLHAWRKAALQFGDASWAEALLQLKVDKEPALDRYVPFTVLPPARKEAFLSGLLKTRQSLFKRSVVFDDDSRELLRLCAHPWSEGFARMVLGALKQHAAGEPNGSLRAQLKDFGRWVPVELSAEAQKDWPDGAQHWESWRDAVEELLSTLQFRKDFHQALKEES